METVVAASPTVVLALTGERGWTSGTKFGELLRERGDLVESKDKAGVALGQIFGEDGGGCSQVGDGSAIGDGGTGEVGKGIDGMLVVVRNGFSIETGGTRSNVECFIVFLVRKGKVEFELWPIFVGGRLLLPGLAIIDKDAGAKHQLVGDVEDLLGGVGGLAGGSKFGGVFYLLEEDFDGLVNIAGFLHGDIVVVQVSGRNFGIGGVKVCQEFKGCASTDADVW